MLIRTWSSFVALLLVLPCCTSESPAPTVGGSGKPGGPVEAGKKDVGDSAADEVAAMRAAIQELDARPEHTDPSLTVRHILIAFQGSERSDATRSKAEAEKLAANLWTRIRGGEKLKGLMRKHSNDPGPGEYPMTTAGRSGMVPAFGNVAWRLKVGGLGVAPHDPVKSPFGWHIIERVK